MDRHRGADRAALASVHVRHDPHSAALRKIEITHPPDLLDRLILYDGRVADGCIHFSFDLKHFLFPTKKAACPFFDKRPDQHIVYANCDPISPIAFRCRFVAR